MNRCFESIDAYALKGACQTNSMSFLGYRKIFLSQWYKSCLLTAYAMRGLFLRTKRRLSKNETTIRNR